MVWPSGAAQASGLVIDLGSPPWFSSNMMGADAKWPWMPKTTGFSWFSRFAPDLSLFFLVFFDFLGFLDFWSQRPCQRTHLCQLPQTPCSLPLAVTGGLWGPGCPKPLVFLVCSICPRLFSIFLLFS